MSEPITLGEYHQRRNALLGQMREAERKLSRVSDSDYTQITSNGANLLRAYLGSLNRQLVALNAQWNFQQSKKERA